MGDHRRQMRHRHRRRLGWLIVPVLVLAACASPADPEAEAPPASVRSDAGGSTTEPPTTVGPGASGSTVVVDVVDGDTVDVRLPDGRIERVRLVGINAPEDGECWSTEAADELERLVEGEAVVLVADESDRDRYDRLLRYVEKDGADIGARLVRDGFALVRVTEPDVAREEGLRRLEEEARSSERGLWDPSACGPASGQADELAIVGLRLDAAGDDAQNLNDEWVEVGNTGAEAADMTGWGVRDESASHRFTFPDGFTLHPGAVVRIHSGCGTDSATELFWCTSGSAIWNNDGDTAFLVDPSGNIVDREAA
jgi:micrococcal nuclease